jgi:hypothetical protein
MANKSGIHINPKHKGEFTKKAKAAGMSVQAFAKHVHAHPDNYSAKTRKQAGFAKATTKFKHQTGGTSLPLLENTNPGMQPIQVAPPSSPTLDIMGNISPHAEPMDQMMPPQPQQQMGRYRRVPVMGENPYVKGFNSLATAATAVGDVIQNGKRNRADRMRLIEGMTPRYMQNMEGAGLNNNPAYTMYGGSGMHGEGTSIGIYDHTDGPNFDQYSKGVESDVSDRRTEADVPVTGKPGKMPRRYMQGGDAQGALGWDYDDGILYMMYGGADFGVPRSYSEMDNEDYGFTGIGHNGPYGKDSVYRAGGQVSSEKAKEILRDGTVHGQPLSDKQKRYFGWIAGGAKKAYGGWTQEGFMMQAGGNAGLSAEDYYKASAELSYYKNKLNDQLKAKNPDAYTQYFQGLQGARSAGQQKGFEYIQNSQYNDYLTPDEVKKSLGSDKDYQNYLNSLKAVNTYNTQQGQQPLWGNTEGQNNDPSQLNYGRRFASLQVTPSFARTVKNPQGDKTYQRNYNYNPGTGQVDFTETGDLSIRPEGFAAPANQANSQTPPPANSVGMRKYGGRKYTAGRSFMTGPAMQFGGEGFAVGDEIEMSEEMLNNLKKQGYKFETL